MGTRNYGSGNCEEMEQGMGQGTMGQGTVRTGNYWAGNCEDSKLLGREL